MTRSMYLDDALRSIGEPEAAETFQQFLEGPIGFVVCVAPKGDRQGADLFNQFKSSRTFLLADLVTQYPSQQPDAFDQRAFVVLGTFGGCWGG